jgi:hypothetical protein
MLLVVLAPACELIAPLTPLPPPSGGGAGGDGGSDGTGQPRYVVVGNGFSHGWSADGMTWNVVDNPESGKDAVGLAYGGGVFVSAGIDVRTSRDGVTWAPATYYNRYSLLAVTYTDGTFLAAGLSGFRMRSTDGGATWGDYTEPSSEWLRGIAAGNGIAVAVTSNFGGTSGMGGWTSSQDLGKTWTPITAAPGPVEHVAFGNGVFVAAGGNHIATSLNGSDWIDTTVDEPGTLFSVLFFDGLFHVIGTSAYWQSTDGTRFTKVNILLPGAIVHGGGLYVGAQYGSLFASTQLDGLSHLTLMTMDTFNAVAFGAASP